ncbi:hypothetical protein CLLI_22530 [Clostridium liquoris]|jgi:hypothetical protein|uniref:Uncharacterized protein n=1 Tax=Clostridium liquoris TaxID=1289519 RepID=A0A2T0B1P9_9CLOT|nr:hypothetical protein [Clostridium liquoris]PRR77689.1 hypothetical protein CLLI_22530 [Clostridium liquoris]
MSTPLEVLKFNLQEREYPYFEDKELELLLETNYNDIKKASYNGCLLKAAADDKLEVAGVKLESNRQYWLTLAETFNEKPSYNYITSMERVDGY